MSLFSWLFGRWSRGAAHGDSATSLSSARIRIDRGEFTLRDIGRRSFVALGYDGWLAPGQRFAFTFVLPGREGSVEVPGHGRVLKVGQGELAAVYDDPQPYYRRQLDRYVQMRGR